MSIRGFAAGIRRDHAAVIAGLEQAWSNGQVEGQVHRLKFLKRPASTAPFRSHFLNGRPCVRTRRRHDPLLEVETLSGQPSRGRLRRWFQPQISGPGCVGVESSGITRSRSRRLDAARPVALQFVSVEHPKGEHYSKSYAGSEKRYLPEAFYVEHVDIIAYQCAAERF